MNCFIDAKYADRLNTEEGRLDPQFLDAVKSQPEARLVFFVARHGSWNGDLVGLTKERVADLLTNEFKIAEIEIADTEEPPQLH